MDTSNLWKTSLNEALQILKACIDNPQLMDACGQFSKVLTETLKNGGRVFSCGNGGSHCDAMHFSEELTGRYRKDRRPLGALALGDPSHMTCVSNDFGFEYIFSRQLEGLARKGDLLLGISTSGKSKNVINAVEVAKKIGVKTVGLLGRDGGPMKSIVDLAIVVPAHTPERIQEMHIKILHTVVESMERVIFPENY